MGDIVKTFADWLRQLPSGLASHLVVISLSAIVGAQYVRVRTWVRTRPARKFWRPFLNPGATIVLGRTLDKVSWERSGLLGIGDALAYAEIRQFLVQLGGTEPTITFAKQVNGDELKRTLILIGGPDVNEVTKDLVRSVNSTLRFGDPKIHDVSVYDSSISPPTIYPQGDNRDCGLIIRTAHPGSPTHTLLILAGSFGHGTLAAARYAMSSEFLSDGLVDAGVDVECLVEANIVRDRPQSIRRTILRSLPERQHSAS